MTEFVNDVFELFTLRPMDSGFRRNDGMNFKMSTLLGNYLKTRHTLQKSNCRQGESWIPACAGMTGWAGRQF